MAKRLLVNILVDVLGNYVDGISSENLKLGVWSGKIELQNLQLKKTALDSLNLPVSISHGTLSKLHVRIPWTSLESKPVKIIIEDVFLQAGPEDILTKSTEELKRSALISKRSRLQAAEELVFKKLNNIAQEDEGLQKKVENTTYIQQLTVKIIDNLEISLKNVHIRYEDSITLPNKTLSAGITISSIALTTTDENWKESFVNRDTGKPGVDHRTHKLGQMENFGIYWIVDSEKFENLTSVEWKARMQSMIYSSSTSSETVPAVSFPSSPMTCSGANTISKSYLLEPPNSLAVKIIERSHCTSTTPKIDINIESSLIPFGLDKYQYHQLMSTFTMFQQMDRQKLIALNRPKERPTKDPRAWWKYALKLVLGKDISAGEKMVTMLKCKKYRNKYMQLVRQAHAAKESNPDATHFEGDTELALIEDELPFTALLVYRQIVAAEIVREQKNQKKALTAKQEKSSFFRMWGSSSTTTPTPSISPSPPTGTGTSLTSSSHEQDSSSTAAVPSSESTQTRDNDKTKASSSFNSFVSMFKSKPAPSPASSLPTSSLKETTESPKKSPTPPASVPSTAATAVANTSLSTASMTSSTSSSLSDSYDEEEDNLLIEKIQKQLMISEEEASKESEFPIRVTLNCSAQLAITSAFQPIALAKMTLSQVIDIKSGENIMQFTLNDVTILDQCTINPLEKYLLKTRNTCSSSSDLTIAEENHKQLTMKVCLSPSGKVSLAVRALPIDFIWNEACIQNLFQAFVSKSSVEMAGSRAFLSDPKLISSLKKYAIEASIPVKGSAVDLDVCISAPTIIIPFDPSRDEGCLILDAGELRCSGFVDVTGVGLEVSLSAVNIGISTSYANRLNNYILKPFDICTKVKNKDKLQAEMSVDMLVSPTIQADLNIRKIKQLLEAFAVISGTMQRAFAEVSTSENGITMTSTPANVLNAAFRDSSSSLALIAETNTSLLTSSSSHLGGSLSDAVIPSPMTNKLFLSISLRGIAAHFEVSSNHTIDLNISNIAMDLTQRSYDYSMNFSLSSIDLSDSSSSQASSEKTPIIWTSISNSTTEHLIQFSLIYIIEVGSPLYRGYDICSSLEFANLGVNLDECTLRRFVPFAGEISDAISSVTSASKVSTALTTPQSTSMTSSDMALVATSSSLNLPQSVMSKMQSMPTTSSGSAITKSSSTSNEKSSTVSISFSCKVGSVSLIVFKPRTLTGTGDNILEKFFSLDIMGLSFDYDIIDLPRIEVSLDSINVQDCRDASQNYKYKSLFCKSSVALEYSSSSGPGDTPDKSLAVVETESTSTVLPNEDKILRVTFNKEAKSTAMVVIDVQNVTSFVSVDSIVDLIDISLSNVNALLEIANAMSKQQNENPSVDSEDINKPEGILNKDEVTSEQKGIKKLQTIVEEPQQKEVEVDREECLINVVVRITNPRLLLLEDPSSPDSKAIVSKGNITMNYTKDIRDVSTNDSRDVLHLTVQDAEVFILQNGISHGNPLQIIDPTGFDIHFNQSVMKDTVLSVGLSVMLDEIRIKVSFHDLLLANSILQNVLTSKKITNKSSKPSSVSNTPALNSTGSSKDSGKGRRSGLNLTLYNITFNSDVISVMIIDDYNGQNLPVVRVDISDLAFSITGPGVELAGSSCMRVGADYYNFNVATWEPIIEPWMPSAEVMLDLHGMKIDISSSKTLQVNISGVMMRNIIQYLSALSEASNADKTNKRIKQRHLNDCPITFKNYLGIHVEVYDHHAKHLMAKMGDFELCPISSSVLHKIYHNEDIDSRVLQRSRSQAAKLPVLYDVILKNTGIPPGSPGGTLTAQKVSLNLKYPKPYQLQFLESKTEIAKRKVNNEGGTFGSMASSHPSKSNSQFSNEPVTEELYQNTRYVLGSWKAPWSNMGDPHEFSDAAGRGNFTLEGFKLPSEQWEWINNWTVDKSGDVDNDGWEYALNFNNFTMSSKRRNYKPLDAVRRRRWTRMRQLKAAGPNISGSSSSNGSMLTRDNKQTRTLTLFWDVQRQRDGSTHVLLRSGFAVQNILPSPIMIRLDGFGDMSAHDFGPVSEGETFYVPLLFCHATTIQFRPIAIATDNSDISDCVWSSAIECRLKTTNHSTSHYDIAIKPLPVAKNISASSTVPQEPKTTASPVFIHLAMTFAEKSLLVRCLPFAVLYNRLPSRLIFSCLSEDGTSQGSIIKSGSTFKLVNVNPLKNPSLSVQLGSYVKSNRKYIDRSRETNFTLDLVSPSDSSGGISITMSTTIDSDGVVIVYLYSKYALVDRTGLNLTIRSKRYDMRQTNGDYHSDSTSVSSSASSASSYGKHFEIEDSLERSSFSSIDKSQNPMHCWTDGGCGLVLFQSGNDEASLGINTDGSEESGAMETVWSRAISLVSLDSSKATIEVVNKNTNVGYLLAYNVARMPKAFELTQILTVVPWFCIVNCTDEVIEVRQNGALNQRIHSYPPRTSNGWHKEDASKKPEVQIRCASTMWSLCSIDLNDIGSYCISLPNKSSRAENSMGLVVLRIEVKFASSNEMSYMSVVIWKEWPLPLIPLSLVPIEDRTKPLQHPELSQKRDGFTLSLRNNTDYPIVIRQDLGNYVTDGSILCRFDVCVPPHEWYPFGWVDQKLKSRILLTLGTTIEGVEQPAILPIDVLKVGKKTTLDLSMIWSFLNGQLITAEVQAIGSGKVVNVSLTNSSVNSDVLDVIGREQKENLAILDADARREDFHVLFRSLGLSIVAERPIRREIFSLYLEGIEGRIIKVSETSTSDASSLLEFKVTDIQIDNYTEATTYPVLLHSYNSVERSQIREEKRRRARLTAFAITKTSDKSSESAIEEPPFFQLTIFKEIPKGLNVPIYKYVALRVLELKLSIDSSTIQLYLLDLHSDLLGKNEIKSVVFADKEDSEDLENWVTSYNSSMISLRTESLIDVSLAHSVAKVDKCYFEQFVLHPIKVNLSFDANPFPRDKKYDLLSTPDYRWLGIIRGFAGVEDLVIKVNSFIVNDAMESFQSLGSRIIYKSIREVQSELVVVIAGQVGSLHLLGNPVGLLSNIGGGVQDFFYEPYQGAMHSPEAFLTGVATGTGFLISGVVTGAISSAAAIVGSTTKTVADGANFLTGDVEFAKRREEKRRESKGKGVLAGLAAGGESVVNGFASGLSGLVTKPMEGGRSGGAAGFFKGVGLGIVGAAVKPLMGVTDGIASIAQGVTNQISDSTIISQARPSRTFERSDIDSADLILTTLDISAAQAQQLIVRLAKQDGYRDVFVSYQSLGSGPNNTFKELTGGALVLSEQFVLLFKADGNYVWKYRYGDISHCTYEAGSDRVELVIYKGSTVASVIIPCTTNERAFQVYKVLAINGFRMGNSSAIVPPEEIEAALGQTGGIGGNACGDSKADSSSRGNKAPVASASVSKSLHYRFGTANVLKFPAVVQSRKDILTSAKDKFMQPYPSRESQDTDINQYAASIDERAMQLVYLWRTNNCHLKACRCCVTIILNLSQSAIQILETEFKEGKNMLFMDVLMMNSNGKDSGYDAETRSIAPNGGAVILFAYGFLPTLVDLAHVKVEITTTAFHSMVSTRPNRTYCEPLGGFSAGFLEKSLTDWWGKYVILVN